ncbi:MAG: hypothetical protein FWG44_07200, partial [Oscillospiraceae bacterium]|nr:hypothetical protein [Oscillospiraceae bacterium]
MSIGRPIVTAKGMIEPYAVTVSGNTAEFDASWHLFKSRFKESSDDVKAITLSSDKFASFDSYGNALEPNNAWVKIQVQPPCIIRTIKW